MFRTSRPMFCVVAACLWGCVQLLYAASGYAAQTVWTPSIGLHEVYDDNAFFEHEADYETRITPTLSYVRTTERQQTQVNAGFTVLRYVENSDRDTLNQSYGVSHSFQAYPRWNLSFRGNYNRDNTFEQALEEEGIVANTSLRHNFSTSPSVTYQLTERQSIGVTPRVQGTIYEDDSFFDQQAYGSSIFYRYIWSEATSLVSNVSYTRKNYKRPYVLLVADSSGNILEDEERDENVWSVFQSVRHQFSERLSGEAGVGVTHTSLEQNNFEGAVDVTGGQAFLAERRTDSSFAFNYSIGATYRFERCSVSSSLRQSTDTSVLGETTNRTSFQSSASYRLQERLTSTVSANYTQSSTDDDSEYSSYSIGPSLRYNVKNSRWSFNLGYSYTHSELNSAGDSEDRNRISAGVQWNFPIDNPI